MTPEQVQSLIDYYVNLLIIQYNNQPKAQATIAAFIQAIEANGILIDIQNAYDLNGSPTNWDESGANWDAGKWDSLTDRPAAVGVQLDVIGKYAGVDRFYRELNLINYFSLITYDEISDLPTSPPRFGFTDYDDYEDYDYNGTLTYSAIISQNNRLLDSAFRVIIKLKILQNNINHSHASIDNGMFFYFGTDIRPESLGHMRMVYFITNGLDVIVQAAIYKKLLPKPMGVGLVLVQQIRGPMFGLSGYDDYESPYAFGFCDYSNYDSLPGQELTYNQISQG